VAPLLVGVVLWVSLEGVVVAGGGGGELVVDVVVACRLGVVEVELEALLAGAWDTFDPLAGAAGWVAAGTSPAGCGALAGCGFCARGVADRFGFAADRAEVGRVTELLVAAAAERAADSAWEPPLWLMAAAAPMPSTTVPVTATITRRRRRPPRIRRRLPTEDGGPSESADTLSVCGRSVVSSCGCSVASGGSGAGSATFGGSDAR
jgi:hypothetical protein